MCLAWGKEPFLCSKYIMNHKRLVFLPLTEQQKKQKTADPKAWEEGIEEVETQIIYKKFYENPKNPSAYPPNFTGHLYDVLPPGIYDAPDPIPYIPNHFRESPTFEEKVKRLTRFRCAPYP